ncbi:MAG: hypothetical protein CME64_14005 [Halobacteriovoraceae bacterium]|nr:hypothetical protein [Halobacteriovoraceae bacterium]|tara:strand:- start:12873 stop:13592 length:720 start_codon:yes stop_codon:yes gene_type:complete
MSKEHFKILKELSSLEIKRSELENLNLKGQKRVEKLIVQQNEAHSDIEKLNSEIQEKRFLSQKSENELTQIDSKLKKIEADIGGSFDSKEMELLDQEKQKLLQKMDEIEMRGLELLEEMESIEEKIGDRKTFAKGIEETIAEIKAEVDAENSDRNKEIETLNGRIDSSLGELPEPFRTTYQKVKAQNLAISMFAKIESRSCSVCKSGVDRAREAQVEEQLLLKTCSSCGRIFIPNQALY